MRKTFSEVLSKAVDEDSSIEILLGDIGVGAFYEARKKFPKQIRNLGILEQAMVSFGSGLALNGKKVIFHTIAPFLVGRAYDQIKVDFGYRKLPALFVSVGASFDYGKMGSTHHCPEDVLLMGQIEGMTICCPSDGQEVERCISDFLKHPKLTYLRLSEKLNVGVDDTKFVDDESSIIRGTLVSIGIFKEVGKNVADILKLKHVQIDTFSSELILSNLIEPIYIIEPFLEGTTNLIASQTFSKYKEVHSFGTPIKFHREYMDVESRYSQLNLDLKNIVDRIRVLQNA